MTDENKIIETKQECFCQSKWFKKFLTVTVGTFVGAFCALSLFAALHKPPMPPCPFPQGPMMRPCHCKMHHQFNKFEKRHYKDFQHKMNKNFSPTTKPVNVEID